MAIQKTTGIPLSVRTGGTPTGPITRTTGAPKSAFEEALARKSASLGQPVASGAINPQTGMTAEQGKVVEQTLGQQAARTILTMPQPKARAGEAEGGLDGE